MAKAEASGHFLHFRLEYIYNDCRLLCPILLLLLFRRLEGSVEEGQEGGGVWGFFDNRICKTGGSILFLAFCGRKD